MRLQSLCNKSEKISEAVKLVLSGSFSLISVARSVEIILQGQQERTAGDMVRLENSNILVVESEVLHVLIEYVIGFEGNAETVLLVRLVELGVQV